VGGGVFWDQRKGKPDEPEHPLKGGDGRGGKKGKAGVHGIGKKTAGGEGGTADGKQFHFPQDGKEARERKKTGEEGRNYLTLVGGGTNVGKLNGKIEFSRLAIPHGRDKKSGGDVSDH